MFACDCLSLQLILFDCWYLSHICLCSIIEKYSAIKRKCNPLVFVEKKLQVTLGELTKVKFVSPILLCHNFASITVILLYTDVCMQKVLCLSILFYYRVVRIVS